MKTFITTFYSYSRRVADSLLCYMEVKNNVKFFLNSFLNGNSPNCFVIFGAKELSSTKPCGF
jgi:hypothetical protein